MLPSFVLAAVTLVSSALAAPTRIQARNNGSPPPINANGTIANELIVSDVDVLQFALTLEYIELTLYEEGVNTFFDQDFKNAGYQAEDRWRFKEIISQEIEHIGELRRSLGMMGAVPTEPCQYNLPALPNVQAFLNTTDIFNGVGPSAYIGAGAFITDKIVLTTGASIGQIEARHNSWLNGIIHRDEFPTAYQLSLSPTQAYSVVAPYIGSCPESNPELKAVLAYPPKLTATNPGAPGKPLVPGAYINLEPGADFKAAPQTNVAFLYSFNPTIVPYENGSAQLPSDIAGQSYAVLTSAKQGEVLTVENTLSALVPFFVDVPASKFKNKNYGKRQYA